jgi:hypothetical protein
MSVDDAAAVLQSLDARGLFTRVNSKTWVSQPERSVARFGETRTWAGGDVFALAARVSSFVPIALAPARGAGGDAESLARLREAERRVGELERALAGLKAALTQAPPAHAADPANG